MLTQTNTKYATITLTFSECIENHVHNQQIGEKATNGFSTDELRHLASLFSNVEYHDLSLYDEDAGVLIIRRGVDQLVHEGASDELLQEQENLTPDSKMFNIRTGTVNNKHARHNLCFADFDQEPDYENRKGRVVSFHSQPVLSELREAITESFGMNLLAEGNYYHSRGQSGIGFHGDTERRCVIGVRLGKQMNLVFRWYKGFKPTGDEYVFSLNHGDVYIMSDKAVGYDWKMSSIYTLRHAAGSSKYTKIETPVEKTCQKNTKIRNPITGKMIMVGGRVYNKLVSDGIIHEEQ